MGRAARPRPERLAEKLKLIRDWLGLSQNDLISRMGLKGVLNQNEISAYECGRREPSLIVLLNIARVVGGRQGTGKILEVLLDDELNLRLPKSTGKKIKTGKNREGRGQAASRKRARR